MDGLAIHISWEWALGIIGFLIAGPATIAWYANGRFTALETSMTWVKETLGELKVSSDNARTPVFLAQSPINLNAIGEEWLAESGLRGYIDLHKESLFTLCADKQSTNPYEVQKHIFQLFDTLRLDPTVENRVKEFAFNKGTTMNIMRRIGAIYFRNLCLEHFGMNREDIDKHDPDAAQKPIANERAEDLKAGAE